MDFEQMANVYMETIYQMRKRNAQRQINDSMHGENFILYFISRDEGIITPSDISNAMGITSARVAAALNSLEGKGMVVRKIDADDRRRILIELTDLGREKVEKHHEKIMNMTTNMLRYLGEEDAMEFVRIMKKLALKKPEDFI